MSTVSASNQTLKRRVIHHKNSNFRRDLKTPPPPTLLIISPVEQCFCHSIPSGNFHSLCRLLDCVVFAAVWDGENIRTQLTKHSRESKTRQRVFVIFFLLRFFLFCVIRITFTRIEFLMASSYPHKSSVCSITFIKFTMTMAMTQIFATAKCEGTTIFTSHKKI